VHVPKTIDNDLDLPHGIPTFGFQTARHIGVELVKSLMVDAETTSRWYFVVTMGRKAGHLALGIGKAAGATLTIIPEEFRRKPIRLKTLVDILVAAFIKRLAAGRSDGVAVLAEGLVEFLDERRKVLDGSVGTYVFPGPRAEDGAFGGFPNHWEQIFRNSALADVTPHVLRHSFASIANDLGFTEVTIAALVGHSKGGAMLLSLADAVPHRTGAHAAQGLSGTEDAMVAPRFIHWDGWRDN